MTLRLPVLPAAPVPRDYGDGYTPADRALLLAPGRLGRHDVRCRIVLPAMESNLGSKDGFVTERLVDYYAARARGGVAWVTTENTSVHPSGRVTPHMLRIETDAHGAAFAPLADAVHAAGALLLVQLSHAGRQTLAEFAGGPPWAPSAIACPVMRDEPRAMTEADVGTLIEAFVAGAVRAQRAGADGVELHMAHGYLLGGFLSPDQNRRDDAWGGDTERRCAFPTAALRGIRQACGDDFVIVARFSADEYVEGGMALDEALAVAPRLVAAGADALHVSACNYESMFWNIPTYFSPEAPFASFAAQVKQVVDVPVIAVGRLHRPAVAARALRGGADFVALGRALIADPSLPARIRAADEDSIRPCLACNRCIASINGAVLECTVNPWVGFEGSERPGSPRSATAGPGSAGDFGRVLVVGGGVAGLSAAAELHARGVDVRLLEERALAGQLDVAAMPPGKEPVGWLLRWLLRWSAAVPRQVGRPLHPDDLQGIDTVIWAAGSTPTRRRFPGDEDLDHVPLDAAMRDPARAGARPLVVGAGAGGSECAHWLAHRGARVTLLEVRRKVAQELLPSLRYFLERELEHEGVDVRVQISGLRFEGSTAIFEQRKAGTVRIDGVTAIVDAAGRSPEPVPAWLSERARVIPLGDAAEPGSIFEATQAAAKLVR